MDVRVHREVSSKQDKCREKMPFETNSSFQKWWSEMGGPFFTSAVTVMPVNRLQVASQEHRSQLERKLFDFDGNVMNGSTRYGLQTCSSAIGRWRLRCDRNSRLIQIQRCANGNEKEEMRNEKKEQKGRVSGWKWSSGNLLNCIPIQMVETKRVCTHSARLLDIDWNFSLYYDSSGAVSARVCTHLLQLEGWKCLKANPDPNRRAHT